MGSESKQKTTAAICGESKQHAGDRQPIPVAIWCTAGLGGSHADGRTRGREATAAGARPRARPDDGLEAEMEVEIRPEREPGKTTSAGTEEADGQRRRGRPETAAAELDRRKRKFQIKARVAACGGCSKPGL
jgi:hypothetical protein